MNLIGHRLWLEGIESHYGSLKQFPDTRTVEIMLRFLQEKVDEELHMRKLLAPHPEELAEWRQHSDPDLLECRGYMKDLEDWLNDRDLVAS